MPYIIVIEHENAVDKDNGIRHLEQRGFQIRFVRPDLGEQLPPMDDNLAGVLVCGGPQYVSRLDWFPYLRDEMNYMQSIMDKRVPLLGICLGAQLIAAQLGADVAFHPDGKVAFGYYPLSVTKAGQDWFPDDLKVLAGNAQGFSLPSNADLLAGGDVFAHQAFSVGQTTMALQFHPEVTRPILDHWQVEMAGNIGKPGSQSIQEQDRGFETFNRRLTEWYQRFLDRFFGNSGAHDARLT